MKTILVPHVDAEGLGPVLDCALHVARRFGSRIEGQHLPRMIPTVVSEAGGVMMTMVETMEGEEEVRAGAARKAFQSFMRKAGVTAGGKGSAKGAGAKAGRVTAQWRASNGRGYDVGSYARLFDLVVCGRPEESPAAPDKGRFEALLFESGRPILIAPTEHPKSLGDKIVIAWNGSTESARAVGFARPLLEAAKKVVVVTVESGMVQGPDGPQLAQALALGGVEATSVHIAADHRSVGEAILDETAKLGGDLLIKGAYTHSRLRQMIFGGATSHILAHAELPVFIAH